MAGLEILFEVPGAGDTAKTFSRRPLGMEFVQKMPIIITMVRGEAHKLGVKKGWRIKAIGGESVDELDFPEAWAIFRRAVEPLHQEFIVRDFPLHLSTVADFRAKFGPVDAAEVVPFLKRYGFTASSATEWGSEPRPELKLGVIDGHRERGDPVCHTWYALHGRLTPVGAKPRRWQVERRLAHMRSLLHGPVRRELGKAYDNHFEGAHFARHTGPPGTTSRLEAWLTAMAKLINEGQLSPTIAAGTLRFLEAPELPEPFEDGAVGAVGASTGTGEAEVEEEEGDGTPHKESEEALKAAAVIPDDRTEDGTDPPAEESASQAEDREAALDSAAAATEEQDPASPSTEAAKFMSL